MLYRIIYLIALVIPTLCKGQSSELPILCKDTNYFVRTKFIYCDSMQPTSLTYKNGKFYERKKHNYNMEDRLAKCKTGWPDAKYFIFLTKDGKKIEEGFYAGIWELTFCKGPYRAYHENGKVQIIGQYEGAYKIGVWKYFSPEGKLQKEIMYDDKGKILSSNSK